MEDTAVPVYLVVDTSDAMAPYMSDVNNGLSTALDRLRDDRLLASHLWLSVLGFERRISSSTRLVRCQELFRVPTPFAAGGIGSHASLYDILMLTLPADLQMLHERGIRLPYREIRPSRPIVFVVTRGAWPDEASRVSIRRAEMIAERWHPDICAIGVGQGLGVTNLSRIKMLASEPNLAFTANSGPQIAEIIWQALLHLLVP